MHARQLAIVRIRNEQIERLALADKRSPSRRHINQNALLHLPRCLVARLDLLRNAGHILDTSIPRNNLLLHVVVPNTELKQLLHQVLVNHNELASKGATSIEIACERLKALVVAQNLRRGCGRHRRDEQRVAHPCRRPQTERSPVQLAPRLRNRRHAPEVGLESSCRCRRRVIHPPVRVLRPRIWIQMTTECLICTLFHGQLARHTDRRIIHVLKDELIEL